MGFGRRTSRSPRGSGNLNLAGKLLAGPQFAGLLPRTAHFAEAGKSYGTSAGVWSCPIVLILMDRGVER